MTIFQDYVWLPCVSIIYYVHLYHCPHYLSLIFIYFLSLPPPITASSCANLCLIHCYIFCCQERAWNIVVFNIFAEYEWMNEWANKLEICLSGQEMWPLSSRVELQSNERNSLKTSPCPVQTISLAWSLFKASSLKDEAAEEIVRRHASGSCPGYLTVCRASLTQLGSLLCRLNCTQILASDSNPHPCTTAAAHLAFLALAILQSLPWFNHLELTGSLL